MNWKKVFYAVFVFVIAIGAALTGAVAGGVAVYRAIGQQQASSLPAESQSVEVVTVSSQDQALVVNTTEVETAVTQAVENTGPAVVTVVGTIPGQRTRFGMTAESTVSGSGVFISVDGYILTNNHVIEDAQTITIILADGSEQAATLVGTDVYSDLAVLQVAGEIPAAAVMGNSDALNQGETVIAIGSPLGEFMNTVTVGVVSATGRSIDTGLGYQIEGLIQTDAAINSGNSGGPLLNLAGEVIGINTLVVRDSSSGTVAEGLGFAIPINTARAVAEQIIEKGYFSRPYVGINWQAITPRIAAIYRLPADYGVYITAVAEGGPAEQAGLQPGDIITGVGETTLDATHAYINTLFEYSPGDMVTLTVIRGSEQIQVDVTLGEAES
ncbi:MAG: trypsin-like peptidase domain-containing protein [Anaerolineales bacterium]|jgi:2-alkenal reductase|nr:trypsin-like peptidase domain-containing protein [Anaerolineales bacterium]